MATKQSINLTPAYLWWVFRQWWMITLPASLLIAAVSSAVIMYYYKPDYRASAVIKIEEMRPYIAFNGQAETGGTHSYVQTQIEMLRSPMVLEPVLSRPEIAAQAEIAASADRLDRLQKNLKISRIGASDLYDISYVSKYPQDAAAVVNAIVAEYLKSQTSGDYQRNQRVIDLLEGVRRNRKMDVERLQQRVMDLAKEVTGRNPFVQGNTLDPDREANPVTALYRQRTEAEVQREVLKAQLQTLREGSAGSLGSDSAGILDLEVESHPAVASAQASIDALMQRATDFKATLKPGVDPATNETYRRLEQELARQQASLKAFKEKVRTDVIAMSEAHEKAKNADAAARIEHELELLDIRSRELNKKFEESVKSMQLGNSKTMDFAFAQADLEREQRVFEMIESRKLAMQTESQAPERVTVMRKASAPLQPITKVPFKLLIMACAASVAAPFGLAVLREVSISRISDVEQLSRETSLRVVGEVSHFPIRRAAANPKLLPRKLRKQMYLYLESVESLRTSLYLAENGKANNVLVVTSAAASEGKTCLATALAMSIAKAHRSPTLIIDGDLRSPDVASVLGIRERPGLAELLTNQASVSEVVQRVGDTNAFVIPAGRLKGSPHHLVQEERIRKLLEQLRSQFSTVVIDTPPIFGGSESLVFAKASDGVLVSVMSEVSRTRQLGVAAERLERAGAKVLGVVLNGASTHKYAYYYGYGAYADRLVEKEA